MRKVSSKYTVSIHYDRRLYEQDIKGSIAHARMLSKQNIITNNDMDIIVQGLETIQGEIENQTFPWLDSLEDIHMNIEKRLFDLIGESAGRLHTARSRNDQVALDIRMYTKDATKDILLGIDEVRSAVMEIAERNIETILPGYTHLQRAQPVSLAHHFMAYFQMFSRDFQRFTQVYRNADVMPLGSGALAGLPYDLDREFVAEQLGFTSISLNSMDAVSDRDFLLDFQSATSICMMHLSRLSEELIIWSSDEFGFVRISEEYTTSSSIMPQKHNPDFAELARGKTSRVFGNLISLLTMLKGLPMTYNRDLQEDKEGFFDSYDTLSETLEVFSGMLPNLVIDSERMLSAARDSYLLATDVADYLVAKGLPFREAYINVSELTNYAIDNNKFLHELKLEEFKRFSTHFEDDVFEVTVESSVAARNTKGGTAFEQVRQSISEAKNKLLKDWKQIP